MTTYLQTKKGLTKVIDATGAGDTFVTGFLYGLSKKKYLETTCSYASIAASAIIAKFVGQFTAEGIVSLKAKLNYAIFTA